MHTIIHIGAGEGHQLDAHLASGAQHILLVEPLPQQAEQLRARTTGQKQVTVIEAAVAPEQAGNELQEFNLTEASSLYQPTGLKTLYPGLRTVATHTVKRLSLDELLQQASLDAEQPNQLILEAPGAEQGLVEQLVASDYLSVFTEIQVVSPETPYYSSNSQAAACRQALETAGYEQQPTESQNPDWPQWQFKRHPLQPKLEAREEEIEKLTSDLEQLKKQLAEAEDKASKTAEERDNKQAKVKELENALKAAEQQSSHHSAELEKLESDLQTAQKDLQEARKQQDDYQRKAEEIGHALTSQQQQNNQLTEERDKNQTKVQELEKALKAAEEQSESRSSEVKKLKEGLESTKQELTEAKKERDARKAKLEELEKALKTTEEKAKAQTGELEKLQQSLKSSEKQLNQIQEEKENYKKSTQKHKESLQQVQSERDEARKKAEKLSAKVEALETQLASQGDQQKTIDKLQKRMEYLFEQNTLQLEQAANALGRHVTTTAQNTTKELESLVYVQQELDTGSAALEYQGEKLSHELARQLANQVKLQPYDLVLVFGAGVATTFLAETLNTQPRLGHNAQAGAEKNADYVEADDNDLPKRILCFDHDRARCKSMQGYLNNKGHSRLVSLKFTPLIEVQHDNQAALFYDCATQLQQVARLFENREARILVLITPPRDSDKADIRATLPQVLQYLAMHTLDVIVNAPHQAELVQRWQTMLDQRGLDYTAAGQADTRQAQQLTVNP